MTALRPGVGFWAIWLTSIFTTPTLAQPLDAHAIWRKALTAGAQTPLRARLSLTVWKAGRAIATQARITQGTGGRYRLEYEAPPVARGRIVIFDGKTRSQYDPHGNYLTQTTLSGPIEPADHADLIERNYRLRLLSSHDSAAGRPAYLLELRPHHAGKSYQRRWIDQKTFKTLRIETYFPDGALARVIAYQQVSYPTSLTEAEFKPTSPIASQQRRTSPSALVPPQERASRAHSLGLKNEEPLGFRLERITSETLGKAKATHLLYSDGIESVSIFAQDSVKPLRSLSRKWRRVLLPGVTAYQNVEGHTDALVWSRGGRRYTAISHLEPEALQAFVRGLLP